MNDLITDLITDSITDVTNKLQSKASSEAKHKSHRHDESAKACEKKVDLETQVATYSCKLETAVSTSSVPDGEGLQSYMRISVLCQLMSLKMDAMRVDEQKIFATTVEIPQAQHVDKIVDAPVVLQHQVLTIQTEQKTPEVPHTQYLDQVIDVPVRDSSVAVH